MTVARLLSEASSYELSEWQTYYAVDAEVQAERQRKAKQEADDAKFMGDI